MSKGYPLNGFKKGDSYKRTKKLNLPYDGDPPANSNIKGKRNPSNPPRPSFPAGNK